MADLPIRPGTPDDRPAVSALLFAAFHHTPDDDVLELDRLTWEPERALVATDGDIIVGHAVAATRELSVPGNVIPAAHVTGVGVAPTHRRRGLLSRMMVRQLREVRDAGREPVAVLWASEGRIYPRFGYGLAASRLELAVESREVRLPAATAVPRLRAGVPAQLRPAPRGVLTATARYTACTVGAWANLSAGGAACGKARRGGRARPARHPRTRASPSARVPAAR